MFIYPVFNDANSLFLCSERIMCFDSYYFHPTRTLIPCSRHSPVPMICPSNLFSAFPALPPSSSRRSPSLAPTQNLRHQT